MGFDEDIDGFNFAINDTDPADNIYFDDGNINPNGTGSLFDDNLDIGGITKWTIKK